MTVVNTKKRSYAEVAKRKGKGKEIERGSPAARLPRQPSTPSATVAQAQAVVMHAAPLRYKPGTMRQWIEEDNKEVEVMGIRWLTRGHSPGKRASALVIYLQSAVEIGRLTMGRKSYYTEKYDWDRGRR